jgi:succinylarginine dihydrolase
MHHIAWESISLLVLLSAVFSPSIAWGQDNATTPPAAATQDGSPQLQDAALGELTPPFR